MTPSAIFPASGAESISGPGLAGTVQGRVEACGITSLGTADINFPVAGSETPSPRNGSPSVGAVGRTLSITYEGNVRIPDIRCAVCLNFHRYAPVCPECGHAQVVTE